MRSILFFLILNISLASFAQGEEVRGGLELSAVPPRTERCLAFLKKIPEDYFHAWIEVPENGDDANSRKIFIFYYGRKAPGFANPIAFFNGGPTYPNHGFKTFEMIAKQRGNWDAYSFIYIDQRGTGCSDPYPRGGDEDTIRRLRWYGSSGIVRDAEAVRRVLLGSEKWKIFGQSYGGFIVHRYVSLFPNSISRASSHAGVLTPDRMERMVDIIYAQYRVLNLYLDKYPDDRNRLQKLHELAAAGTCLKINGGRASCGFWNTDPFLFELGFSDGWDYYFHARLAEIVPEGTVDLEKWAAYVEQNFETENATELEFAEAVISYYDRDTAGFTEANCREAYAQILSRGIDERDLILNECQISLQEHSLPNMRDRVKVVLGNAQDLLTIENFKVGLLQMQPNAFYLYSGERDVFVPRESFGPEATSLGTNLRYKNFPDSGHEGFYSENQIWQDLLD